MIEKKIIIIDDDEETIEVWADNIYRIEQRTKFRISYDFINPIPFLDMENGFEQFKLHLLNDYLSSNIDLIACDYNWSEFENQREYPFKAIDYIRTYNQNCSIFMYSGALRQMIQHIADGGTTRSRERMSRILTTSRIASFVQRTSIEETTETLLGLPSLGLQIETQLLKFRNLKFEYGYDIFEGKTLEEVAIEVRKQSPQGARYTEYIIQKGLNHMIDLQIP